MDPVTGMEVAAGLAGAGVLAVARGETLRQRALGHGGDCFRVVLPSEFSDRAMEQFVDGCHGALRPQGRRLIEGQPWSTIELWASPTSLELRIWVPEAIGEGFVATQLRAAFPGARLEPVEEAEIAGEVAGGWVVGRGAGLLRTATPAPGLSILATGLRGLAVGEHALVQVLITSEPPRAQAQMLRTADHLLKGRTTREGQRIAPTLAERARAQRLQQKAARSLFSTSLRILCWAPEVAIARRRAQAVASGFHGFATSELHFTRRRVVAWPRFRRAVVERRRVRVPAATLLNSDELSALLSVTPAVVRELGLPATTSRQLAPPPEIPTEGRVIGIADTPSGPRRVAIDVPSSRTHLICTGSTGSGKSELLLSLATQDMIAGRAVVVIDPKGGLLPELLRRVPEHRIRDIRILDTSSEHVAGMNVLEVRPGEDAERVCDDLVGVFHAVYAASWGQRTADILRSSLLTLVRVPGSTLIELPRLLLDDAFRARYLRAVDDPIGLGPFWAGWEALSPAARAEYAGPVLNKTRDLLLLRSRLRNVLGQSRSTIDIDDILNHRGLLFCDLSKGLLGEEAAALLGSLLVARVWQATRRRAAITEANRPDASLYVDEFQDLVGGATHFEEVLSQSRSLRLAVHAFGQHLDAVPAGLRLAVLQNARSKIVFQTSSADARRFAREFAPWLTEADLRGLGRYEAACALAADGRTARPFVARTILAPPPIRPDHAPVLEAAQRRYTRPRDAVEAEIRRRFEEPRTSTGGRFGRRAVTDRPTDRLDEHPEQTAQPGGRGGESRNDYPGASQ